MYVDKLFDRNEISTIYFCPHTFERYSSFGNTDKGRFNLCTNFFTKFLVFCDNMLFTCYSYLLEADYHCVYLKLINLEKYLECFLKYFLEKEEIEPIKFDSGERFSTVI